MEGREEREGERETRTRTFKYLFFFGQAAGTRAAKTLRGKKTSCWRLSSFWDCVSGKAGDSLSHTSIGQSMQQTPRHVGVAPSTRNPPRRAPPGTDIGIRFFPLPSTTRGANSQRLASSCPTAAIGPHHVLRPLSSLLCPPAGGSACYTSLCRRCPETTQTAAAQHSRRGSTFDTTNISIALVAAGTRPEDGEEAGCRRQRDPGRDPTQAYQLPEGQERPYRARGLGVSRLAMDTAHAQQNCSRGRRRGRGRLVL